MIVMKFGGTSVATAHALTQVAAAVRHALPQEPVVVVSALRGVTDALLALEEMQGMDRHLAVEALLQHHLGVARGLGVTAVQGPLAVLTTMLREALAPLVVGWTEAQRDHVVGYGERFATLLVVAALQHQGLAATAIDARAMIRTDARFGAALPETAVVRSLVSAVLEPVLAEGLVPVTQGFIGRTADGRDTTLGRGGSDVTAALLGAALGADRVEIWTDVDGIMTADPRVVPAARVLPHATYDEAAELAAFGAKVLHPATQLPLATAAIPIVIRNTFAPLAPGTEVGMSEGRVGPEGISSIAFRPGTTVLRVRAARMLGAYGFLRQIFAVFERHELVVDVLATSEVSVSLTVEPSPRLAAVIEELQLIGEVTVLPGCGIVAVVGRGLRDAPGVAARVFSAIADVNVLMISQGASASNLTFLVPEQEGPRVVRALHDTFFPEGACAC